jgi:hypothetical protein
VHVFTCTVFVLCVWEDPRGGSVDLLLRPCLNSLLYVFLYLYSVYDQVVYGGRW